MKPLGIRDRILLAALAPAVLVALLVTGVLVLGQWQNAIEAQHRRIAAMARQIAATAEFNLFAGNIGGLQRQLELALGEPDILAAAFLTPKARSSPVPYRLRRFPNQTRSTLASRFLKSNMARLPAGMPSRSARRRPASTTCSRCRSRTRR